MTRWSEILKASKGLHARDSFSKLWGLKIKSHGSEWPETTISGSLPLTYESRAKHILKNYLLHGSSEGAGVQTENLFDKDNPNIVKAYINFNDIIVAYPNNGLIYAPVTTGETYTISGFKRYLSALDIKWGITASIPENGVSCTRTGLLNQSSSLTVTITSGEAYLCIFLCGDGDYSQYGSVERAITKNVETGMLVSGSTAPASYIPHGYKLPLTVESGEQSQDYPLYIGSTKLDEEEYLDYGEQKIYKLKDVHTDTVTINGIEWDILGYDHDEVYDSNGNRAQHTVTIQTHEAIYDRQFDAPEAWYYAENGLTAGTYYFTIDPTYQPTYNTYSGYQFTLANDVPAGGVLTMSWASNTQASGMKISSYATRSDTTAIETVSIEEGTNGTNLGQLTSAGDPTNNLNSISRARYGSNNYNESAIRQFLNSDKAAGTYWKPQTKFDRPPSWNASSNGYLYGMDPDFVSVLGEVKKVTAKNTVTDGGGTVTTDEKVFLLSMTEAYCGGSEGSPYDYFKNYSDSSSATTGADSNRIKYRNGTAKYWWLRSPHPSNADFPRHIGTSGALTSHYASSATGVAPACCIILDDIQNNTWLKSHFLKPVDPPAPFPAITAYKGENTLSSTETVGTVTVTGRIKETET